MDRQRHNETGRLWAKAHPEAIRAIKARCSAPNLEFINRTKLGPCTDCRKQYNPWVMDFDHVRGTKRFNISQGICRSLESIKLEVAKCELVCANCHRERTYRRNNAR